MRVEHELLVPGGFELVWTLARDLAVIAACMPGAELTGTTDDGKGTGALTVSFGPTRVKWLGELELTSDDEARTVLVNARGKDQRGQSRAKALIELRVEPDGNATRLSLQSDVEVAGVLAPFAKTGGVPILRSLTSDFCDNFSAYVEAYGSGETEPELKSASGQVNALHDMRRAITDSAQRRFGRGKDAGRSADGHVEGTGR